jgi:hypothetical protein
MPRAYACSIAMMLTGAIYFAARYVHWRRTGRWF